MKEIYGRKKHLEEVRNFRKCDGVSGRIWERNFKKRNKSINKEAETVEFWDRDV